MALRSAKVIIHSDALKHNLARIRHYAPQANVMPAIKADGYGHGAVNIAQALAAEVDGFALATLDEALQLREAGSRMPLLVFQGAWQPEQIELALHHELRLVVHDQQQLELLKQHRGDLQTLKLALKLDTGMHRLGLAADAASDALDSLTAAGLADIWLMSHFCCADDQANSATTEQIARFDELASRYPNLPSTLANSAGIVAWPDSHRDWVRPGIMFYGGNPLLQGNAEDLGLRAAMTLQAPLIAVRQLQAGDAVGYGATWRATEATRVGVVACGYADGYPRHAPNGTPVWLNGRQALLLGRVSMDVVVIHLQDIPAQVGDMVELWGDNIPVDTVASMAETISYELLCHAGSLNPRVFQG